MRNLKTTLLAATVLASVASPAYAQFAFPTVELDGAGATTVGDINVKVMKCIGVDVDYGVNNSTTLQPIAAADYTPSVPTAGNPELDCSLGQDIYNGATTFTGKYVGTGSGFGRQIWRNFSGLNFLGTASSTNPHAAYTSASGVSPITGGWTNVQYALSESPLTVSDMSDYNALNTETATVNGVASTQIDVEADAAAGPAIQIPLYVVPIAFAYAPSYGKNVAGQNMNFNVKVPVIVNAVNSGGLRMRKDTYCRIFNGQITNWNNNTPVFGLQALNGNQPLFDPLTDNATRWAAEGAPIRLIGRAENSGGTNVFTRAMAAQCNIAGVTNKFAKAGDSLPYDNTSTININNLTSSQYRPAAGLTPAQLTAQAIALAGTAQSIGGVVYDANGVFCDWSALVATVCSAPLANPGAATLGLFTVANGSTGVEAAIASVTAGSFLTLPSGVQINGKFGYIGGDFTAPTPGRTLHSVAAQVGTGAAFAMPTAANANIAFGTVFAPQSIAGSGAYNVTDPRIVYKDLTNVALPGDSAATIAGKVEAVSRSNPIHWANILYPAPFNLDGTPGTVRPTLANPTTGYPVTGTAQILTYTCFSSSAKVHGIANYLQYIMGKVTKKNAIGGTPASINLSANTFPGTAAANLGVLTKSNIATVPAGWRTAIVETFLKKSTQKANGTTGPTLGSLNLWIQSAQATTNVPHTATGAGAAATNLGTIDEGAGGTLIDNRNPQCVVGGVADNAAASLPGA